MLTNRNICIRFVTVTLLFVAHTKSFTATTATIGRGVSNRRSSFTSTVPSNHVSSISLRATSITPSTWEELESTLETKKVECNNDEGRKPLVTLYRDTNGWCPFCERVWLALRIKGIPYEEQLINLRDKPSWFTQIVPTSLVPAVLIHNDMIDEDNNAKNDEDENETNIKAQPQRTLVWESLDIMKALDEKFPETQRLVFDDDPKYLEAREVVSKVSQAGVKFVYGGRNETMSEDEKLERKQNFISALDDLDSFLKRDEKDGPFLLSGNTPTGADIEIVPTLERWRYQLPLTAMIDISEGRSGISAWFDAMDTFEPYADRVAGDKYSWTAVASTFLRLFSIGGKDLTPDEAAAVERADAAADAMRKDFALTVDVEGGSEYKANHALEAATKLISNRDAVIADCTRAEPLSQKEMGRAKNPDVADLALRSAVHALLSGEDVVAPDFGGDSSAAEDAAVAVRTVAARLCVPRDMGAPAAKTLRCVLERTALTIEGAISPASTAKDGEAVTV